MKKLGKIRENFSCLSVDNHDFQKVNTLFTRTFTCSRYISFKSTISARSSSSYKKTKKNNNNNNNNN
ncbi:hypothetical protein HanXRQr2_Chr10g0460001 [Helianthus annuus]|uniref:Uncharacterized protein n=1 Tax=Helianthus annuus TaxID=4232 RepID=A0A9K3N5G6_HELAN|nr:hypothetical protein HanXRQr2_Chr10g0460001 [Helianthus annuus]